MINADKITGMTSSGAVAGQVKTGMSNPRAKNPTAKWAIGEMLITSGGVGGVSDEPVTTCASWHPVQLPGSPPQAGGAPASGCARPASSPGVLTVGLVPSPDGFDV